MTSITLLEPATTKIFYTIVGATGSTHDARMLEESSFSKFSCWKSAA